MKKLIILALLVAGMTSCSGEGKEKANDSDSLKQDSTVVAEDTATVEEETPQTGFLSDDLKKFGLLGRVKSVSKPQKNLSPNNYSDCLIEYALIDDALSFNEEGQKTAPKNFLYPDMKTGNDGFIKIFSSDLGSSDGSFAKITVIETNEWGWPLKAKYEFNNTGIEEGEGSLSYSYPGIDDHGNWTTRKISASLDCNVYDDASENNTNKSLKGTITTKRTITYY